MALPDALDFDAAAIRISRFMAVIALAGTVAGLLVWGWRWGAGFLAGSAISGFNYRWLVRLVESLGGGRKARSSSVFLALRYFLLGGVAYVILRYTSISLPAVLTGLFVLTAAVFVEVVFELIYARK